LAFLVCIEGIDGSGKSTQSALLQENLLSAGFQVCVRSYPVYSSFFGRVIGEALAADTEVSAAAQDPRSMALWYGMDRWLDFHSNPDVFATRGFVILNRYTLSSIVYQSTRSSTPHQISNWIEELEHNILGLPKPNLYIILNTHHCEAMSKVLEKGVRDYIGNKSDIYEQDQDLQERAREMYVYLGRSLPNANIVECQDSAGRMLSPDLIANDVLASVLKAYQLAHVRSDGERL